MGDKIGELLLMMRLESISVGLLGSYNESLTWWAIIEKANIKAILGLR